MSTIRQNLDQLNALALLDNNKIVDDMLSYFNRQTDHSTIRTSIKSRYGVGISKEETNLNDPNKVTETYTKTNFTEQVDAGMIGQISLGFSQKIIGALATLFTEDGLKFTLNHETVEDLEKADELLEENRSDGGFISAITECDSQSVAVGSSGLLLGFADNHMTYQVVAPSQVQIYFADQIESNGELRAVDRTDLEDASIVVIRLSQVDLLQYRYLAIYGRSDLYPNGRYATFVANLDYSRIPSPGEIDVKDYEIDGVIANPLSYFANLNPDMVLPEYPLAIIDGVVTQSDHPMPWTTSLYENCLEFDMGASHLLSTSQDAARGTTAVVVDQVGAGQPLPRSLSGYISLKPGQTVEHIDHGAEESIHAMSVLDMEQIRVAGGYGVPDYMINEDSLNRGNESASGVALAIKTKPLIRNRKKRINKNTPTVDKIFDIEKSLINLYSDADESTKNLLLECTQHWEPGQIKIPENQNETADRLVKLVELGIIDTIQGIREYYNVATIAEAIDIYESMDARKEDYPSLAVVEESQESTFNQ